MVFVMEAGENGMLGDQGREEVFKVHVLPFFDQFCRLGLGTFWGRKGNGGKVKDKSCLKVTSES